MDGQEKHKFPPIIELNVGGRFFTTTHLTLTKCPDNMLSAMFSGKYSVIRDKDGRYFIDADGDNFIHILNYLRYGDIPSQRIAEAVYREATYFGIHGLVDELEKYPQILAKIQRNNYRNQFPGFGDCLDTVINVSSQTASSETTEVILLLYKKENEPNNEDFNLNHVCLCKHPHSDRNSTFDAKLGPWKAESCEKDVLNCLMFDLTSQGFVVTAKALGQCKYGHEDEKCAKMFFSLCFYWWK
ncbi:BTB/POZ domain-containing protein KCTD7-like [Mya arenaria]|uniref:BTB/POZ domain-containing protein KCTD7-like n=1 Tax=Mya arenaria TaxID=6604 RepID=UPI0022E77187|nr:BTB/POZ domain-containing protein KCTD7-like [Mya arenaria]